MILHMDIEKAKRYSLMEVVLLAVFVFGLLIAHIIVKEGIHKDA